MTLSTAPALAGGGAGGASDNGANAGGAGGTSVGSGNGGAGGDGSDPGAAGSSGGGGGGAGTSPGAGGEATGAGGGTGSGPNGIDGSGGRGGAHGDVFSGFVGGNGGKGGNGLGGANENGGGGGGGGAGGNGSTYTGTAVQFNAPALGGDGGDGGMGGFGPTIYGGGGAGGDGGFGLQSLQSASVTTVAAGSGGTGGNGGNGGASGGSGANGGDGGDGGAGFFSAQPTTLQIVNGSFTGGNGGIGGAGASSAVAGDGGDGGAGLLFGSTATVTVYSAATIRGGNGANGGAQVSGGSAGTDGAGGVGIKGAGLDITLRTAGLVSGGLGGDGSTRANAIEFTGGTNRLTVHASPLITGDVVANGTSDTFDLGGTSNGTFNVSFVGPSTQFRGFEFFEKTGTSTWTLNGSTTEATPWTISAGTLSVNGSIAASAVSVADGARLQGNGTVGSFVAASGAVVGPGNSIGTLSVDNGAMFQSGSTFEAEIDAGGNADLLAVTGQASLAGTLNVLALNYPTGYPSSQNYTIITATGGVSGQFDTVTDNLPDIDLAVTYNANDVIVGYGQSSDLSGLSAKEIYPNSLQAVSGSGRLFANTLTQYGVVLPDMPFAQGDAGSADGWSVRTSLLGSRRDVEMVGGVAGYSVADFGVAGGADRRFDLGDGSGRLGFGFGYLASDAQSGASSADVDGLYVGLYGGVENGPLAASASMAYGWQDYDFSRSISLDAGGPATATGSASGETFASSIEVSYDLAERMGLGRAHGFRLAPTARVDYVHARRDGFAEDGAGVLNLTVAPDSLDRTWLGAGIAMSARFAADEGPVFTPSLKLFYEHLAAGRSASTSSSIPLASASFVSPGVLENEDYLSLEAGLGVEVSESVSLDFGYKGAFASHADSHTGNVGLKVRF